MDRRGFLGRAAGAIAALPILAKSPSKTPLPSRLVVGRLRPMSLHKTTTTGENVAMSPDFGLMAGQQVSMSALGVARAQQDAPTFTGFGVIIYTDPGKTIIYELQSRLVNA